MEELISALNAQHESDIAATRFDVSLCVYVLSIASFHSLHALSDHDQYESKLSDLQMQLANKENELQQREEEFRQNEGSNDEIIKRYEDQLEEVRLSLSLSLYLPLSHTHTCISIQQAFSTRCVCAGSFSLCVLHCWPSGGDSISARSTVLFLDLSISPPHHAHPSYD